MAEKHENVNGGSILQFLLSRYDLSARIRKLDGHVDRNFLLEVDDHPSYVLKLSEDLTSKPFLEAQHLILEQLKSVDRYRFPEIIPGKDGQRIYVYTDEEGRQYIARVLRYIPGNFLAECEKSSELLYDLGVFLGSMDKILQKNRSTEIISRHYEWDLQHFPEYTELTECIPDPARKKLVDYFLLQYRENVEPVRHKLRKSLIHNDANDWNILSDGKQIIGAIDFGDAVFSHTIHEAAVGATYIALGAIDPLRNISLVLEGYNSIIPLEELELDLFYYLIAARLCMSACQSACLKRRDPDNAYLSIHEEAVWDLLERWVSISPDLAADIFRRSCGFGPIPVKTPGDYIRKRDKHISKALSVSYDSPIVMQRAAFQYMFDQSGKTYLDAVNNIMHVGHCHPHVVEAGQRQLALLNTNTRYLYDALNEYAERLLLKFPEGLNKVFFVNSGSAASDLAIRLARSFTGRKDLIVMDHGYHGNTSTGIEISPYKFSGRGGAGAESHIHIAPLPGAGPQDQFTESELHGRIDEYMTFPVAAFICEPIVGCGGQVMLREDYLKTIYGKVRSNGGVCIADEVQTGFGRTGSGFWAYELYDVIPDIVILGKPMGNGHPIGAVVTTSAIAGAFENGMEFFSSFGGNPVSCRIGSAVLDVIDSESLQENAWYTGEHLMAGLRQLQADHEMIHDVRGSGLFLGIELTARGNPKQPATREARVIINRMKDRGILLSTDGPHNNVIKIKPPICFSRQNADQLIDEFEKALSRLNSA